MSYADEVRTYYERSEERDRLTSAKGALELERTQEILLRHLPTAPAVVADIGGGPGRYAVWLADLGYRVEHRDLMALHVQQLASSGRVEIRTAVADALDLDLDEAAVDAALLLGPLYHLRECADRVRALAEAARVVRPGGVVFAAVISRWAPRLDGVVTDRLYAKLPNLLDLVPGVERTGDLPPAHPGAFAAYTHRPDELLAEVREAGLLVEDLVGVEGMPLSVAETTARRADPIDWQVLLDAARAIERVPELLGLSPHLICTARRPG
ncbi:MAG TPA: class I SAM-dependent methyltransferase [Microlunatus sp.]